MKFNLTKLFINDYFIEFSGAEMHHRTCIVFLANFIIQTIMNYKKLSSFELFYKEKKKTIKFDSSFK